MFSRSIAKSKLARPANGNRFLKLRSKRLKSGAFRSCCRGPQSPFTIGVHVASPAGAIYGLVGSGPPHVAAFEPVQIGWPVGLVTSFANGLTVFPIRSRGRR